MRLFQVRFRHYSQKDSEEGVRVVLLAENEETIISWMIQHLSIPWKYWEEGDTGSINPTEEWWTEHDGARERAADLNLMVDSVWHSVEGPKANLLRFWRGDFDGPSDTYYGHTSWSWEPGKEVTPEEADLLIRLGVAEYPVTVYGYQPRIVRGPGAVTLHCHFLGKIPAQPCYGDVRAATYQGQGCYVCDGHRPLIKGRTYRAPRSVPSLVFPCPSSPEEKPERWWSPSEYADAWLEKSVRLLAAYGGQEAGARGQVDDWKDGHPTVEFEDGTWIGVPLDLLEKL